MTKPGTTQSRVPVEAIEDLVEYLRDAEYRHYQEGRDRDHIWHSIKKVMGWLDTLPDTTSRAA